VSVIQEETIAMYKIQRTIDIKAPVQRVYDFLNQPTNLPSIWPNLGSVSNIVPRPGGAHDFDWVYKMAGVQLRGHTSVVDAQPGKFVRLRNEGGIPSTFHWTYAGHDGLGTRLSVEVEYAIPAPVIGKMAEALVAKLNERDLDTLLANLKDVMQHGTGSIRAGAQAP
jgi:uncharacterized membrane protein